VKSLLEHDAYDATNPNRVRALIGAFCQNFAEFHRADGESYKFLTSQVLKIQEFNPQLAARIVAPLLYWRRFDQGRQELMRACLEKIAETSGIAPGVLEPVARALDLELTKS